MSGFTLTPTDPVVDTVRPVTGKYKFILGSGNNGTTANALYRMDSSGNLTLLTGLSAVTSGDYGIEIVGGSVVRSAITWLGLVTGASHAFAATDRGAYYSRSNAGAAMADTLPTLNNTTDVGFTIKISNEDTVPAASLVVTAAGGGNLFRSSIGVLSANSTIYYGSRQTFVWTGAYWVYDSGNSGLVHAPNAPAANDLAVFTDATGRYIEGASQATGSIGVGGKVLTNGASPVGTTDLATKGYVDGLFQGANNRDQAVTVITSNQALSGLPTNDGVTLTAGQQALLVGQTNPVQNGLWAVAAGAWSRPVGFATGFDATGTYVFVESGSQYGGSGWIISGAGPTLVDTAAQTWTQFSGLGEITVDATLTKAGNQLSRPALTGDVTAPTGSNVLTIGNNAVTNAKAAQMAAGTIKANLGGATANPTDATLVALAAALPAATATTQGALSPAQYSFLAAIDGSALVFVTSNPYSNLKCDGATDDAAALNALYAAVPDAATLQWPGEASTTVLASAAVIPSGKHIRHVGGGFTGKTNILQTSLTADHFTCGDWYNTFDGFTFITNNTTTTAAQALTSGTVLTLAANNMVNVPASGSLYVNSATGWQLLTYSARNTANGTTQVTLSQTGTGSCVAGYPIVFKTAGAAVNAGNLVGIDMKNCSGTGLFNGYVCSGSTSNASMVDNFHSLNTINYDVWIDGANWNGIVKNCTTDCTVYSRTATHLLITQCGAITGDNNQWIRGTVNMQLGGTTVAYPGGVFSIYFDKCFYDNAGADAVRIAGTCAVQRVKLTHSWLSSAQTGMGLNLSNTAATLPTDISLIDCNIYANATNGIGGNGAQDLVVVDSQIAGNGTAGINCFIPKLRIVNNRIGPVGGIGANGTGIILPAGAYTSVQIHDNDLLGNTTAPLTDNSTSIATKDIRANAGLVMPPAPTTAAQASFSTTATYVTPGIPIPANSLRPGTKIRLTVELSFASTAASTATQSVKFGTAGTTADATVLTNGTTTTATTGAAKIVVEMTVRTIGAAGGVAFTITNVNNAAGGYMNTNTLMAVNTTTINTTVANFLGLTLVTGATTNVVTVQDVYYEVISQ